MKSVIRFASVAVLAFGLLVAGSWAQAAPDSAAAFAPFEQWKSVVLSGDAGALKALYSTDPAAQVRVGGVMHPADADTSFWLGLKAHSIKVEIIRQIAGPERASVIFRADVVSGLPNPEIVTVTDDQYWLKQGEQWRLVAVERTDSPRLKQPSDMKKNIYPADVDAHVEIKAAEERAAREHKRLLLIFGANWCFDCHVLDLAFQGPDLAPVLAPNYELVHVDLGPDGHKNADVLQQFDVSLDKGVPVLAVAESDGKVVVSQKDGEFEDARRLTPEVLLEFLNKWKPQAR